MLNEGNESDIEEFDDECAENFEPWENVDPADESSEIEVSAVQPARPQPSTSSHGRTLQPDRPGTWRQVSFNDKTHEYSPVPSGSVRTPIEYVKDYFDENFFAHAAHCTNTYHLRKTGKELKTNPQEMAKLFAIHLIVGVIPFPRLPMYWRSSIADQMSRDRFLQLRNALHCVDSDTQSLPLNNESPNPLWKVQPIIDRVRTACNKLERVPGYYSIDEQIIPFTGRCALRQVVKNKPRPVGLKNFVLTTSDGLMLDFDIYRGAKTMFGATNLGLGASVVLHLTKTVPPGSCVYYDRYFTTVPLIEELDKRNIHGTGTIMMNRIPGRAAVKFKADRVMSRGESQQFVRDSVVLVKWKDNKSVLMASNCTGAENTDFVKRWDKQNKSYIDVSAPRVISNYNRHMGGVDVLDQMMEYYRAFLKTKKWTLKVIIHFLDLAVANACRQYKINCEADKWPRKKVSDLLEFRMDVADAWMNIPGKSRQFSDDSDTEVELPTVKKKYMPPTPTVTKRYDGYDHLPTFDDIKAPRSCRLETCTSRSKICCTKCKVYLCLSRGKDCFRLYHTKH